MHFFMRTRVRSNSETAPLRTGSPTPLVDEHYEPPLLLAPGRVRRITLGSSASGNADANSQYYW